MECLLIMLAAIYFGFRLLSEFIAENKAGIEREYMDAKQGKDYLIQKYGKSIGEVIWKRETKKHPELLPEKERREQ